MKLKDLTGQKFGRLTALYRAENKVTSGGNKKVVWFCQCDCGNKININSNDLLMGRSKSCGCYNREAISKRMKKLMKKYNTYDLTNEYGIGYTLKGEEFYFDLEDYDKIKDYCWYKHHTGYITAKNTKTDSHCTLHKLVMDDLDNEYMFDHINNNKVDCSKSNLRKATYSQNNRNVKNRRNNKSGTTGVHWRKREQAWYAHIVVNKKDIYLGTYKKIKDAVAARKKAEDKYFGEWSYDNSQKNNTNKGD